jgi:hypothetical protein
MVQNYQLTEYQSGLSHERVPQGHPVIVDYFYHEEIRGSDNTGARNKKGGTTK